MAVTAGQRITAAMWNELADLPLAHLRQTVAQALPSNTWTAILLDVEDYDTHNGHSTTVSTTRYTCQRAGMYELAGGTSFAGNNLSYRAARWHRNGAAVSGSELDMMPITSGGPDATRCATKTCMVRLAAGDYVEVCGWHNTGVSLNTTVDSPQGQSTATIKYVGP